LKTHPADEEINIQVVIEDIKLQPLKDSILKGSFSSSNIIFSSVNKDKLFEYTANFNFSARFEIEGDFSFNLLVLPNGFSLNNVVVPSEYENVNETTLNNFLSNSYSILLVQRPVYLFNSIPFYKKFSRINDIRYIKGEGFLIIGEHVPIKITN